MAHGPVANGRIVAFFGQMAVGVEPGLAIWISMAAAICAGRLSRHFRTFPAPVRLVHAEQSLGGRQVVLGEYVE